MPFLYQLVTVLIFTFSYQGDVPFTSIEKAFAAQDATAIVGYGKEKIILNVLGKDGVYSHAQAVLVLKDFFNRKPGSSFKFYFKGKESPSGCFAIGTYESKTESFRITIQFSKIGSDQKIESLTIEKV
jgi:hypothetical protein